jgi:hypothetical protein
MKLKRALCLRVLPMLLAATAISSAATIINATLEGCVECVGLSRVLHLVKRSPSPALRRYRSCSQPEHIPSRMRPSRGPTQPGIPQPGYNPNGYWTFGAANVGAVSTATSGTVLLEDYVGTAVQVSKAWPPRRGPGRCRNSHRSQSMMEQRC